MMCNLFPTPPPQSLSLQNSSFIIRTNLSRALDVNFYLEAEEAQRPTREDYK